ncbi:MAG: general secretion pathway protein GspB [Thermodesulfobacteriota bacterium]|jgi:hypothetical protein
MSLILDALRKLDREKSARLDGVVNIAAEILRPDLTRPGKRITLYFAVVSLTAVATAAITYAVVEFAFLSKSSPPASMNPPTRSQQVAPASADSGFLSKSSAPAPVSPSVPHQQIAPSPLALEAVRDVRDEIDRVPPKTQNPAESKNLAETKNKTERKDPATPPGEKEASQNVISEKVNSAPGNAERPAEQIPGASAATPPSLRVSAIVWYEEPSRRFAMINGTIANEGSVIEGVKVEEIYADHVRLSHNGRLFEISIK